MREEDMERGLYRERRRDTHGKKILGGKRDKYGEVKEDIQGSDIYKDLYKDFYKNVQRNVHGDIYWDKIYMGKILIWKEIIHIYRERTQE